jgi:hypothetical protein
LKNIIPFTALFIACGFAASLWIVDARAPFEDAPTLPHRPATGNHGQGAMIDAKHCPKGSQPYYMDNGVFLTCMRGTT